MESIKTDVLIDKAKQNINQLLYIGLHNTDENIKDVYGGEHGLLRLIQGYMCLLEDLHGFKAKEEAEQALADMKGV